MSLRSRTWAAALLVLAATGEPLVAQGFTLILEVSKLRGDAPLAVDFQIRTEPRGHTNKALTLDFGDGSERQVYGMTRPRSFPHVYEKPGTYTATAVFTDSVGTEHRATLTVSAINSGETPLPKPKPGQRLAAAAGEPLCVGEGNQAVCTIIADTGGLPLPRQWQEELNRRRQDEAEQRRVDSAVAKSLEVPGAMLLDPDSFARKLYGDSTLDYRTRRMIEDRVNQHNALALDALGRRAFELSGAGEHAQARALLDSVATQAAATGYGGREVRDRIDQGRRKLEVAEIGGRLAAIRDSLKLPDHAESMRLFEERERLVKRLGEIGAQQSTYARAQISKDDRATAVDALLTEGRIWELAADHAGDDDRRALLAKAGDAAGYWMILGKGDPEQGTAAQLEYARVQARRSVVPGKDAYEERENQTRMDAAATSFRETLDKAPGDGARLVRAFLHGEIPADVLREGLALLDPADRQRAVALLATASDMREQASLTQDRRLGQTARGLSMNYDEIKRRTQGDTAALNRFTGKIAGVQSAWAGVDSLRGVLAEAQRRGMRSDSIDMLGKKLDEALDNADTKWYDVHYDYQTLVNPGDTFNRNIQSPLTERNLIFRKDATHRTKDVNLAFSEVEAYNNYFLHLPPEEVVRLSATSLAIIGAGLVAGPTSALIADLAAAPIAAGIAQTAVRHAVQIGTEAVLSTATDTYIFSPALNETLLKGSGVRIGREYTGDIWTELQTFGLESARAAITSAAMMPLAARGASAGANLGRAVEKAGGNRLLQAAARQGAAITYEMAGITAMAAGGELASSWWEGRGFDMDRVRAEALTGIVSMPASKVAQIGGREIESRLPKPIVMVPGGRQQLETVRALEGEYTQTRRQLREEMARGAPDQVLVESLTDRTSRLGGELGRQYRRLEHLAQPEAVRARIEAVEGEAAALRGTATAVRTGAKARGRIVEVDQWEMARVGKDLEASGAEVTPVGPRGQRLIARDPNTGESTMLVPREYASPAEQLAARRKARALEAVRNYEIERLGRLDRQTSEHLQDKYTTRWEDLGTERAHRTPALRERAQRGRQVMESVIKSRGVEMVPKPGLSAQGRRRHAQVRREGGSWKIEYDPETATYLDIREEVRHLDRDVEKSEGAEGLTTRGRERIAELREARDRAQRLLAVGADGPTAAEAVNRVIEETARIREITAPGVESRVMTMGSPVGRLGRDPPRAVREGTEEQRNAWLAVEQARGRVELLWHALTRQGGKAEAWRHILERGSERARTALGEETEGQMRRTLELADKDKQLFGELTDRYVHQIERIKALEQEVQADPAKADAAQREAEAIQPDNLLDLPVREAKKRDLSAVTPDDPWQRLWNGELERAGSQGSAKAQRDAKVVVNRRMGEAAAREGGPGLEHILRTQYPPGSRIVPLFRDVPAYSGVLDEVRAVLGPNGEVLEIIIVEAKGGEGAKPSKRIVNVDPGPGGKPEAAYYEQGTPEHTVSTLVNLESRSQLNPEEVLPKDITRLLNALAQDKLRFFFVWADSPSQVRVQEVEGADWSGTLSRLTKQWNDRLEKLRLAGQLTGEIPPANP